MNSAPVTDTEAAWLGGLLQLNDSFYPTGSYAHSFGLEGLVQEGIVQDRETLRGFLFASVLPALRQGELPLVVHAWEALGASDWTQLGELCQLAHAMRNSQEARTASANIGRQRVELIESLRAHPVAAEYLRRARMEGWPFATPVSVAVEGRVLGAPIEAVLTAYAYASLAGTVAAAMKLLRLGQQGAQSLLVEVLACLPAEIARARTVARAEIGWVNPWLDIAAARHETSDFRLFIS